ncbi:MAG TPA: MauE/DoxX family redox-associated membrane protein [Hanamia sp.]
MINRSTDIISLKNDFRINNHIFIADIISGILLLLFLYTSLSKLADYETFKNVLSASPLLKPLASVVAWLLPVTELVLVVLLFFPAVRLKGLYASFIFISLFTLYLIYMITFTPDLPCQCGGVLKLLTWPQHIFFNLFFILLSLSGIIL